MGDRRGFFFFSGGVSRRAKVGVGGMDFSFEKRASVICGRSVSGTNIEGGCCRVL